MFKPCAIVPSRNHHAVLTELVRHLQGSGLFVFIIDDASDEPTRSTLAALDAPSQGVVVYRFDTNQGKGGAVIKGFALATEAGFTHAVQIDADGQHDLAMLPQFLKMGEAHPTALILGAPNFVGSVPRGRRIGRWITHFWIGIETLSPRVIDAMCGFRLYPLAPVMKLLSEERIGRRMDFDVEILVRLVWRGVAPLTLPVRVAYPPGNLSNFRLIRDNWLITWMHTRLVLAMLLRLPQILRNRPKPVDGPDHWSAMAERGAYWGLRALAAVYRVTGQRGLMAALLPIALYFHLTGVEQRRASRLFLSRAYAARGEHRRPGWIDSLGHSLAFARTTAESFAAWLGGIDSNIVEPTNEAEIARVAKSGRGILLIVSHLGNIELCRALLDDELRSRLTLLVHTRHAENYVRLVQRFRPDSVVNTVQVSEINPATIISLKETIDRGGWVAIAGDRTPIRGDDRVSLAPFLGHDAPFPQGPYMLAHLLGCPVYLMFCLRENARYRLHFEKFAERIELPRQGREAAVNQWVARYARRIEDYCLRDPFQWYNFFDFWAMAQTPSKVAAR